MVKPVIHVPRMTDLRRRVLLFFILLGFCVLLGRAVFLQGVHTDFLQQKGDARYSRVLMLAAHRGKITDRHGEILARSAPVEAVVATLPNLVINDQKRIHLAQLLDISPEELHKKIDDPRRDFVYLKRRMKPEDADRIMRLGIPGIGLQREYRRYYPDAEVTAHLVGFTDIDDRGQEGMELIHQSVLSGKPGQRRVLRDRRGRIVEDLDAIKVPQDGRDLQLSIDRKIQYLAHRELTRAVLEHRAKAGSIVVLDARTGEVLAISNWPTYNPNKPVNIAGRSRNRAVVDMFEPGSTMKPFIISAALDGGKFTPESTIDVGRGAYAIGGRVIHDEHAKGVMTVAQVLQKSSNIGTAKMGMTMAPHALWGTFHQLGFGVKSQAGFPGESAGRLRPWKDWRPIEQATMCFGQGITVTLLQMARAYGVFANDGELKPLSLLKLKELPIGQQVMSAQTARQMRDMLELVTQAGGTAPQAQVMGYRVAGKTGTAQKVENGAYVKGRYVASFIGMAPASQPRLIVAVMIDEPSAGQHYGGAVAGPVFSRVMAGALRTLAVPQDAPTNNIVIPPDGFPVVGDVT